MAQSKMTQILTELGHLSSWGMTEAPGRTNEPPLSVFETIWKMITFPVTRGGWVPIRSVALGMSCNPGEGDFIIKAGLRA